MRDRHLGAWITYDIAAHGYGLIISGVAYPIYFSAYVAMDRGNADLLWGIAIGLPLLAAGFIGPLIGALADSSGRLRALLLLSTAGSSFGAAMLVTVGSGEVVSGILWFAFAHFMHLVAASLYNSYLPLISRAGQRSRISGLGWGLSYFGSVICFLLCLPFTMGGLAPENIETFSYSFLVSAAFVAIIGLPAAMALPSNARQATSSAAPLARLRLTLGEWKADRNIPKFLLAYYLINDGVVTVVFFTALMFRKTFGLDVQEILLLSLVIQLVAIPSTILAGWLGGKWSQRGMVNLALVLWLVILVLMATVDGLQGAMLIAPAIGLVLGSTQSLLRSVYADMTPADRAAEFFGFHMLVGRASAAIGPLLFGLISAATDSQRTAMLSLSIFFILGGWALGRVSIPRSAAA